ncbi:DEAD/DEAH box helicase family protein [Paraclostridium bifermentans]|uniref:DEAD/DEAH box helicase family protein n=1 Tax=Paraclostridium bifermentans TaxID=1490 RepID=UPI00387A8DDE
MWNSSDILTEEWISEYESVYKSQKNIMKMQKSFKSKTKKLTLNLMQPEAVKSLDQLRLENKNKALLISATGTGKTYLSTFDVQNFKPKKLLFLVHREQILKQALNSFKSVLGDEINMGLLSGNKKEIYSDYLFSTIQMMSKNDVHTMFEPHHFDYIIIDETHKAGSNSYLKLMKYFKPKFLLGMTATPERTDGFNIYELFDYNIAYGRKFAVPIPLFRYNRFSDKW